MNRLYSFILILLIATGCTVSDVADPPPSADVTSTAIHSSVIPTEMLPSIKELSPNDLSEQFDISLCPTATVTPTVQADVQPADTTIQAEVGDAVEPETGVTLPVPVGPTPDATEIARREEMLQGVNPSEIVGSGDGDVVPPEQGATNGSDSSTPTPCP